MNYGSTSYGSVTYNGLYESASVTPDSNYPAFSADFAIVSRRQFQYKAVVEYPYESLTPPPATPNLILFVDVLNPKRYGKRNNQHRDFVFPPPFAPVRFSIDPSATPPLWLPRRSNRQPLGVSVEPPFPTLVISGIPTFVAPPRIVRKVNNQPLGTEFSVTYIDPVPLYPNTFVEPYRRPRARLPLPQSIFDIPRIDEVVSADLPTFVSSTSIVYPRQFQYKALSEYPYAPILELVTLPRFDQPTRTFKPRRTSGTSVFDTPRFEQVVVYTYSDFIESATPYKRLVRVRNPLLTPAVTTIHSRKVKDPNRPIGVVTFNR